MKLPHRCHRPRGTQPAEYAKYLEQEFAFYSKIVKDADINNILRILAEFSGLNIVSSDDV